MGVFVASRRGFDFETHLGVWQLAKTVVMHDDFGEALSAKNQIETAQSTPPAGVFECALSRGSIQWEHDEETRTQHTCRLVPSSTWWRTEALRLALTGR